MAGGSDAGGTAAGGRQAGGAVGGVEHNGMANGGGDPGDGGGAGTATYGGTFSDGGTAGNGGTSGDGGASGDGGIGGMPTRDVPLVVTAGRIAAEELGIDGALFYDKDPLATVTPMSVTEQTGDICFALTVPSDVGHYGVTFNFSFVQEDGGFPSPYDRVARGVTGIGFELDGDSPPNDVVFYIDGEEAPPTESGACGLVAIKPALGVHRVDFDDLTHPCTAGQSPLTGDTESLKKFWLVVNAKPTAQSYDFCIKNLVVLRD